MTQNSEADIAQHILDNISSIIFDEYVMISAHSLRFSLNGVKFTSYLYDYDVKHSYLYMSGIDLNIPASIATRVYNAVEAKYYELVEIERVKKVNIQRAKLGLKEYVVATDKEKPVVSPYVSNTPTLEDILDRGRDKFKRDTIFDKFKAWIMK